MIFYGNVLALAKNTYMAEARRNICLLNGEADRDSFTSLLSLFYSFKIT